MDDVSLSPDSFSGPIGKDLNGLVSGWQMLKYRPLSSTGFCKLPKEIVENLSSHQFYEYRVWWTVMSATPDNDLAQLTVGGLSHARWLTLACRILMSRLSPKQTPAKL